MLHSELLFSSDLVSWELRGHVFPDLASWPRWAEGRMWAPELHWVEARQGFVVFFTAADGADKLNVGAAVAADRGDPWGEYRDLGRPLVVDTNSMAGALDPHYFLDPVTRYRAIFFR